MATDEDIAILVCCHYFGGGGSLLEREGMLDEAIRSRGHKGRVVAVETKKEIDDDDAGAVAQCAAALLRERGWGGIIDTYSVALGSFKHSIVVYSAA